MTRTRLIPALLAAVALLLGAAGPADAAPSHKKAIWGPAVVNGASQFPIYRDLGVGVYQTFVNWRATAPTRPLHPRDPNDPAYRWAPEIDFAVAEAERYGIGVSLMVLRTPAWANGGEGTTVPPTSAQDYAKFVEATARRYPSVRLFMVWGEPIRRANYRVSRGERSPNYYVKPGDSQEKGLPTFNAAQRRDARRYAQLVDATYARLKKRSRAYRIIGGNTTTSGDVDPFNWVKWMRLANGKPPRMDMFGHNPFATRRPDLRKDQILAGTADFSDLDVFVPWIDRWLGRRGRNRKLPLFLSEYTAPTDVPSYEFPYYLTRRAQAQWLAAGLRIARRWSRIYTFGWIGLRDPPLRDGEESRTGLIDANDVRKPAYYAYKRG